MDLRANTLTVEASLLPNGTGKPSKTDGKPVAERNLRRAFNDAKKRAGLDRLEDRLSWHPLRHSFASMLATDLELPATTLAALTGHSDPGFTLRVYARDSRDATTIVKDVLRRASEARVAR